MRIRKARKSDFVEIVRLARAYNLNYFGMEADDFWVAVDGPDIIGICGLRRNPDCLELCSLGVEEARRHEGLGTKLVKRLLKDIGGEVHLATVIPQFFQPLGFEKTPVRPLSMVKTEEWCAGCRPELCTVMVRRGRG